MKFDWPRAAVVLLIVVVGLLLLYMIGIGVFFTLFSLSDWQF